MTRTVSRLFDSYSQAQAAVEALEQAGFTSSEISLVSRYRDDNTLARRRGVQYRDRRHGRRARRWRRRTPGGSRPHSHSRHRPACCSGSVGDNACGCCWWVGCGRFDRRAHKCRSKRGRGPRVSRKACGGGVPSSPSPRMMHAHSKAEIDPKCRTSLSTYARGARTYVAGGWSKYDPDAKGYTADEIRQERETYLRR